MGRFADFVASLTGSTSGEASRAGHDFRDDSGARNGSDREQFKSAPDWAPKTTESGISYTPEGKDSDSK
jgi:hypothetical protein